MRVTSERVHRLAALGLYDGQARAYLALLDLGAAGVGDVARATGLPRTGFWRSTRMGRAVQHRFCQRFWSRP